jgi:hypothetical protein
VPGTPNEPEGDKVPSRETLSDLAFGEGLVTTGTGRFSGKLYLVLLDDKTHPSIRGGRSLWGLSKPITYRPRNGDWTITVPAGFVTDLASIHASFGRYFRRTGRGSKRQSSTTTSTTRAVRACGKAMSQALPDPLITLAQKQTGFFAMPWRIAASISSAETSSISPFASAAGWAGDLALPQGAMGARC